MSETEVCESLGVPWPAIESTARRYLRNWVADGDELDDLTQDCLLKVWLKGSSFSGRGRWTSWLYRIARNEFVSRARRVAREPRSARGWVECPADRVLGAITLQRAIEHLPAAQREVVELACGSGLTSAEIGEHLGLADSTVRCRKMAARATLAHLRAGFG